MKCHGDRADGSLPKALGGVVVTFDGKRRTLFYQAKQSDQRQVPFEVDGNRRRSGQVVTAEGSQGRGDDAPQPAGRGVVGGGESSSRRMARGDT